MRVRDARRTVRFRVTALATLAVSAILVVAGVLLVDAQERLLEENLRDAIEQRSDDVAALVAEPGTRRPPSVAGSDGIVVRVAEGTPRPEGWTRVDAAPGLDEDALVLVRHVGGTTVEVTGALDDIEESTQTLATSMTIGVPVAAAVLAALIWWLVGRTLRPVETIRAEVADISGSDLGRRVAVPPGDDEIARLARTMNAMLDRVEGAVRRQQQFVADASHELRSPLARMRSELEVDAAHPADADMAATHRSVLQEAIGLQRLVDDLLHLARRDAGTDDGGRREPVDVDDLVLRAADHVRARVGPDITVDLRGVTGAQVRGDADQLARVVANLADNAARHAATTVTFTLAERDGVAELSVADDGPGVPHEDRERIFDRFARLDDARTGTTGGTGLGLAIARDIVERHGGTIAVEPASSEPGGAGARFVVTLPLPRQSYVASTDHLPPST